MEVNWVGALAVASSIGALVTSILGLVRTQNELTQVAHELSVEDAERVRSLLAKSVDEEDIRTFVRTLDAHRPGADRLHHLLANREPQSVLQILRRVAGHIEARPSDA